MISKDDDLQSVRAAIEAKFEPSLVRSTLAIAGLFQVVHEMIKREVLHKVRECYWRGCSDYKSFYDEALYKAEVLDLSSKGKFEGSLRWLVGHEAISQVQADRLTDLKKHRDDLAHELFKYLVDPDSLPDMTLLKDALEILRALKRFWLSFEVENVADLDEAVPGDMAALGLVLDAFIDGLPEVRV